MIKLQDYINSLHSPSLSLAERIQAIADLIPGLKAEAPGEYGYFVKHPDYEAIGNLTDLARLWLECAHRCHTEHAPFQVRLIHQSMDDSIHQVYAAGDKLLVKASKDGVFLDPVDGFVNAGCPCCNTDSKILEKLHGCLALTFDEEEYQSLWGDEKSMGWNTRSGGPEGKSKVVSRLASREQVERALRETEAPTGDVIGQAEKTGA